MSGAVLVRALTTVLLLSGCAQVLGIEETKLEEPIDMEGDDDPVDSGSDDDDDTNADDDVVPDADTPNENPGEDFRCLGDTWLEEADSERIEIIASITEIDSGTNPIYVEGMKVRVCRSRLDISCSGGAEVESDANGLARVEVDKGFDGYLRIEGPDANGIERVGYLWYFSQPLMNTYIFPIAAMTPDFRRDVIYGAALGSGIEWDDTRGEIAINVTDCSEPDPQRQEVDGEEVLSAPGVNAPGVHFAITDEDAFDEATRQFYFSGGNPVWPRRVADQITDVLGLGGFLNIPPGPVPIEAVLESVGATIGSDTLLVRANYLTTVRLLPQ